MTCSGVSRLADLKPPRPDELEVVVCGPSYGEAILVHIGDNRWLAVDSCFCGPNRTPAPLFYLGQIGVAPTQLELIAATHWHDDHVGGLYDVVIAAPQSKVCIPNALRSEEFMTLAVAHGESNFSGGVRQLYKILNEVEEKRVEFCSGSLLLLDTHTSAGHVQVYALSPSSDEFRQSLLTLRSLHAKAGQPVGKSAAQRPNDVAMVLQVRVGTTCFVLGADLEEQGSALRGWQAVIGQTAALAGASLFKVPHHGSVTAYHAPVWTNWLGESPVAVLTPFHRGRSKLPTTEEVTKLKAHTPFAYISTLKPVVKVEKKTRIVESDVQIKTKGGGLLRDSNAAGIVRCRISPSSGSGAWEVGLYGDASQL